jgi:hypothetical protein
MTFHPFLRERYSWLERALSRTTHTSSEPNRPPLRINIKAVLETNAHLALDVNTRPVREDLSRLEKLVTASPDVRRLLAFQSDPLQLKSEQKKTERRTKEDSPCPNRCFSSPKPASAKYPRAAVSTAPARTPCTAEKEASVCAKSTCCHIARCAGEILDSESAYVWARRGR